MRVGCLVLSIAGLLCGLFMLTPMVSKDGSFNYYFSYGSAILLFLVCGIYILSYFVRKSRERAETQAGATTPANIQTAIQQPPPHQEQYQPPQQSSSSVGVLFVPKPLPGDQFRQEPNDT